MARKRTSEEAHELPIFDPESYAGKKEGSRNRAPYSEKLVHLVLVIVILSFFILWWCSSPVKVMTQGGKIVSITPMLVSLMNDTTADRHSFPNTDHIELKAQYIHLSNGTAATIPKAEVEEGSFLS